MAGKIPVNATEVVPLNYCRRCGTTERVGGQQEPWWFPWWLCLNCEYDLEYGPDDARIIDPMIFEAIEKINTEHLDLK